MATRSQAQASRPEPLQPPPAHSPRSGSHCHRRGGVQVAACWVARPEHRPSRVAAKHTDIDDSCYPLRQHTVTPQTRHHNAKNRNQPAARAPKEAPLCTQAPPHSRKPPVLSPRSGQLLQSQKGFYSWTLPLSPTSTRRNPWHTSRGTCMRLGQPPPSLHASYTSSVATRQKYERTGCVSALPDGRTQLQERARPHSA